MSKRSSKKRIDAVREPQPFDDDEVTETVIEDQDSEDDVSAEHDKDVPDAVLERRRASRKAEAAALAQGKNVIDEGGVLCDLDTLTIAELKHKLAMHFEYTPYNRHGIPRQRLQVVLERRLKERDGYKSEAEKAAQVEAMSAKEYVSHTLEGFDYLDDAYPNTFAEEQVHNALKKMSRDAAVIKIGNAVKYLVPGIDSDGRSEYRFLSAHDFHQLYANVRIPNQAVIDAGLGNAKAGGHHLSVLWDKWRGRRELEGIGFFPGSEKHKSKVPRGYLNMWTGLAIEPKKGDWSLFRAHLLEKVCGGDKKNFDFLMDWLAHVVQRPQEKPGSAIVLKSTQKGSGKSMLLKFLRAIFGRHLYSAAKIDQLTGRFNGHLEETLIFGVEEGFWAGSPAASSALKDLITGDHIAIERKGLDSRSVLNFTRFIFLSNESWVVPAGTDERRYFVLEFENDRAKDRDYFDPIFEQMDERGGIAALLHELMHREIKSNLRNPPTTAGLLKQREHTLDGIDRFLSELAREGEIVSQSSDRVEQLKLGGTVKLIAKSIVYEVAVRFTDRYEGRALQTILGVRLAGVGVSSKDAGRGEARKVFVFPPLADFRAAVSKVLGLPITPDPVDATGWEASGSTRSGVVSIEVHKAKRQSKKRSA